MLLVLSLLLSGCSASRSSDEPPAVWDVLGVQSEDITSIELVYHDQAVPLNEDQLQSFLTMLNGAAPFVPDNDHAYKPSDYTIVFRSADESIAASFVWFEGRIALDPPKEGMFEYSPSRYALLDTRFDLLIDGKTYSFRQDNAEGNSLWNETIICMIYDSNAKKEGLKARYQLDGFDRESFNLIPSYTPVEIPGLSEVLFHERNDLIVLAQYVGKTYSDDPVYRRFGDHVFDVADVLHGNSTGVIRMHSQTGVSAEADPSFLWGYYPDILSPVFEEGSYYLLCLGAEQDGTYFLPLQQFSCAVLDHDTLYPAYNTEYHPFSAVLLSNIIEMLQDHQS